MAFHGCKFESVYSIAYHGKISPSFDRNLGHRFFDSSPGIYVHSDATKKKAEWYSRYVRLCGDDIFWASVWEVRVDRSRKIPVTTCRTDQWVQAEGSVELVALWVRGRHYSELEDCDEVQAAWHPLLEANPMNWPQPRNA